MNKSKRQFITAMGAFTTAVITDNLSAKTIPNTQHHKTPQTANISTQLVKQSFLVSTNQQQAWQYLNSFTIGLPDSSTLFNYDFSIQLEQAKQTIDGFGATFSENGWAALSILSAQQRKDIFTELFSPSFGANFSICRTPIAANDMSFGWYSYNEHVGDFSQNNFSVNNDYHSLIPFIQSALTVNPKLVIWASPWSPPTWMKTNKHYAMAPAWPGEPSNGITSQQHGHEGADYFIQTQKHLASYAKYFACYIEKYRQQGINISAVMPQNEFNSAQPFPSCCWTPKGLMNFMPYLARALKPLNTKILLGSMERGNENLIYQVLADKEIAESLSGVGFQWAGKHALTHIHRKMPKLGIWATEQECGFGTNDWHYAKYTWSLLKHYLANGASVYQYWNMVLDKHNPRSTWGWPQNSLISVDKVNKSYHYNHEYYLLKHVSSAVELGAKYIPTMSYMGFENQLAFQNPDDSIVIVMHNEMAQAMSVRVKINDNVIYIDLPADSFNTLKIIKEDLA